MITHEQFKQIKELQCVGFTQKKVHKKLGIKLSQISKWWKSTEEEFLEAEKNPRTLREPQLMNYKDFVVEILRMHPQIRQTAIYYRMMDKYPDLRVSKPTFYRFIKRVREETGYAQFTNRIYGAVEKKAIGEEAQVDFGQFKMKNMYGSNSNVYFFCMVLSYSNFKFVHFEPKPFTHCLHLCFRCCIINI